MPNNHWLISSYWAGPCVQKLAQNTIAAGISAYHIIQAGTRWFRTIFRRNTCHGRSSSVCTRSLCNDQVGIPVSWPEILGHTESMSLSSRSLKARTQLGSCSPDQIMSSQQCPSKFQIEHQSLSSLHHKPKVRS